MLRSTAGFLAVTTLKILAILPPGIIVALGTPLLPIYALFRVQTRRRLKQMQVWVPHSPTPLTYYRTRLKLAALSLRHLKGKLDDMPIQVEGEELYDAALATGKPVVLLGWHQGPVELLHHLPYCDGRPFYIITAAGFARSLSRLLEKGRERKGKQVVASEDVYHALRNLARKSGVLAVMVDQVSGQPSGFFFLWNNAVQIPRIAELLTWLKNHEALFLAVTVRLEKKDSILFRYQPVEPDEKSLGLLLEKSLEENPSQYNWSYPKIHINRSSVP